MSFGNRTDKCKPIVSYSQALMFFTRRPKVRSSRWAENARPIYVSADGKFSTRMHQYRLVAGPHDPTTATPVYFDLVLHNTSVIRYMAPTEDGKRVVYLTYDGWPTLLTRQFMWRHGWYYGQKLYTTDGMPVTVPLNYRAKSEDWVDGQWLAKLTFDTDNKLIVAESDHMPVYKRKSSAADKAVRATLREKMDLLHDMLWFSIEGIQADMMGSVDARYASTYALQRDFGPFTSALDRLNGAYRTQIWTARAEFIDPAIEFSTPTIAAMRCLYMCAYQYTYGRLELDRDNAESTPPAQDAVKKAVNGYLMALINVKDGTHYEPLPKFMLADEFPARTHFMKPR